MSTQTLSYFEIASQLPEAAEATFHNVRWEDYEALVEQVGETAGLRISFDDGTLRIMTISSEHEHYSSFLNRLLGLVSVRLRINVRSFGSATMKKRISQKGVEPDASFYVQTADVIGNRISIDFSADPPPDIALEIDIHHDSRDKYTIYASFGVPEFWRFDGRLLTILLLDQGRYEPADASRALPMLSAEILTQFLGRLREEGETRCARRIRRMASVFGLLIAL